MNSKDIIAQLELTNPNVHKAFCRNMIFAVLHGHNNLGELKNTPIDISRTTIEDYEAAVYGHRVDLHAAVDPHGIYKAYVHLQVSRLLESRPDLVQDGELTKKGDLILHNIVKFSVDHLRILGDNGVAEHRQDDKILDHLGDDTYNSFCDFMAGLFVSSNATKSHTTSRLLNTLHAQTLIATKIDEEEVKRISTEFLNQLNSDIQEEFGEDVIFLDRVKDPHSKHTKVTTQGDRYEIDTLKDNFAGRIVILSGKNEGERKQLSFRILRRIQENYADKYISLEGKIVGHVSRRHKTIRTLGIRKTETNIKSPQKKKKENNKYNKLLQYLNSKKKSAEKYVERKFYIAIPDGDGNQITGEIGVVTLKEYLRNESNEGGRFYYDIIRIVEEKIRISPGRNGIIHKENLINIIDHYIKSRFKQTRKKIKFLKKSRKDKELNLFNDIYTKQEFGDSTSINFLEQTFSLYGEEYEINEKNKNKFDEFLQIVAEKLTDEFLKRKRLVVVKSIKHKGDQHICPNQDYLMSSVIIKQRVDIGRLPAGVNIALDVAGKSNIISTDAIQEGYALHTTNPTTS